MNLKQYINLGLIVRSTIAIAIGLSATVLKTESALSAEKVKLIYGPFNGNISVSSLEKYAATGEITGEFRLYSRFVNQKAMSQLRHWLSSRFESDRVEMYKFTNTPEGEKFLKELGTVIKTHYQGNGFYAIRSSLIETADLPNDSDGWTVIEAMQNFPTEDLQINTKDLFKLQKSWSENPHNNRAALDIFTPQAQEVTKK